MKNLIRSLTLCAATGVVVALATTKTYAVNVLGDPNFDLNNGSWNFFNGASITLGTGPGLLPPLSASNVLNLTTLNNVPGAFQQFAAQPGDLWTMTGFGQVDNAAGPGSPLLGGTAFGGLQITFFNAANVNLGTVETSPGNALFSNQINGGSPLLAWIPLTVSAHAPAGTAYGQAFAIMVDFGSAVPEGILVDNTSLSITPVPEPTTLALAGLAAAMFGLRRRK
jgi:hypothetical protein